LFKNQEFYFDNLQFLIYFSKKRLYLIVMIHELKQILWVETPHGRGQVLFLMDYGPHENTILLVALEKTQELKHYNTNQVKIEFNYTLSK